MAALNENIKITLTLDGDQATYTAERFGTVLNKMMGDIKKSADASKALDDRFNGLGQSFRDLVQVGGMLRFVMYDIRDIFNVTFGAVAKSSGEIERMTKLMEGLSSATDRVTRKQEALASKAFVFNMAKNAPFEVKALSDSFVKLKSVGIDPTNGSMQTLVDSVARFGGTGEQLKRASVAIQQMAGKGVVSMEELRQQLGEAVPDAIQAMAVGTGLSMSELVKRISKGQVEAQSALKRMLAVMREWNRGAAQEMMDTWTGQLEVLKTNLTLFANDVGNGGFFEVIKQQLKELNGFLEGADGRKFAREIGMAFADVVISLGEAAKWFRENIELVKTFGQAMLLAWGGAKLFAAIKALSNVFDAIKLKYNSTIASAIIAERERVTAVNQASAEILRVRQAEAQALITRTMASAREEIVQNKAKLTALSQQRLQYEAEIIAMENRMKIASRTKDLEQLRSLMQEKAALTQRVAAHRAAIQAIILEEKMLNVAMTNTGAVLRSETMQRTAALKTMGATIAGTGIVARTTATAMGVLRGAMALMGGPIGIITTALSLGALAWFEWGSKAEEAVKRARASLKMGMSDSNTALAFARQRGELLAEEARILASIQNVRTNGAAMGLPDVSGMVKKLEGQLAEVRKKVSSNLIELNTAVDQTERNAIDDSVRRNQANMEVGLKQIEEFYTKRQLVLEEKRSKGLMQDKEYTEELKKEAVALYGAQADYIQKGMTMIDNRIKGSSDTFFNKAFEAQKLNLFKLKQQKDELKNNASTIGTEPNYLNGKDPNAGGGAKVSEKAEDWLRDARNDILILGEKYKGVSMAAENIAEFREEAAARLKDLLDQGKLDTVIGSGKKSQTVKATAIPAGFIDVEATRLALKKYGADYEREVNAAIDRMNKLDEKIAKDQARADEGRKNAYLSMTQPTVVLPNSVIQYREKLAGEISNIKSLYAIGLIQKEEFDRRIANATAGGKGVEASLMAESAMQYIESLKEKREALQESLLTEREAIVARYERERAEIIKNANLNALTSAERIEAEKQLNGMLLALAEKHARDMETPMQKLAREWKDVAGQMRNATTDWMNEGVDAIMNFVKTGKMEFGDLVESILDDMLRIKIQEQMAKAADSFLNAGAEMLGSAMGGSSGGFDFGSLAGSIGSFFGFANGGIMTSSGALELRKYANGGIANRPQLALYGEGKLPEAYVPLPDGRTIPVTMSGGMGGGTIVNVNVTEGPGTQAQVNQRTDENGNVTLDIMIEKIEGRMAKNINSGRGQMASTIERVYGLNRRAGSYR